MVQMQLVCLAPGKVARGFGCEANACHLSESSLRPPGGRPVDRKFHHC